MSVRVNVMVTVDSSVFLAMKSQCMVLLSVNTNLTVSFTFCLYHISYLDMMGRFFDMIAHLLLSQRFFPEMDFQAGIARFFVIDIYGVSGRSYHNRER